MVVLDTNVVSELMRDVPHAGVLVWVDDRPTRQLFVTAVTEAEVRTDIRPRVLTQLMPPLDDPTCRRPGHDDQESG